MKRTLVLLAIVGLVVASCGGEETSASSTTALPTTTSMASTTITTTTSTTIATTTTSLVPPPPSYTVIELIEAQPTGDVEVSGSLFNGGGGWSLCSALMESFPPQCGGFSLVIPNFDPTGVEVVSEQGIQWSDQIQTVRGEFVDERLIFAEEPYGLSAEDIAIVEAFQAFALGGDADGLPLADNGLALGLADQIITTLATDDVGDLAGWYVDQEAFRGWVGPFSALELLSEDRPTKMLLGPHNHCAAPPVPPPSDFIDLRRVSVFPTDSTSCLEWWTVDFFIDAAGKVHAITLDRWEP